MTKRTSVKYDYGDQRCPECGSAAVILGSSEEDEYGEHFGKWVCPRCGSEGTYKLLGWEENPYDVPKEHYKGEHDTFTEVQLYYEP